MNKRRASFKFILVAVFGFLSLSISTSASAFRVLFIGNSFTGFSQSTLERFRNASPLGDDQFSYIFTGGRDLDRHLQEASTVAAVQNGNWDYVVLQDHSRQTLRNLAEFDSAVRQFTTIIREAGAEPILFQTWARLETGGYESRQRTVNARYNELAAELDIHVMAVGETWLYIHNTNLAYFDRLHDPDRIHQTPLGATTVGAAIYKVLYDTDLSWAPVESTIRNAVLQSVDTRPAFNNGDRERAEREAQLRRARAASSAVTLLLD